MWKRMWKRRRRNRAVYVWGMHTLRDDYYYTNPTFAY
jgi:hypothetical protein